MPLFDVLILGRVESDTAEEARRNVEAFVRDSSALSSVMTRVVVSAYDPKLDTVDGKIAALEKTTRTCRELTAQLLREKEKAE